MTNTESKRSTTYNPSFNPYENSYLERNSMYDKMPYVWNSDLNTEKIFTRVTGNIIKAYKIESDKPYEIKH
mgnify:FL=1